LNDNIVPIVLRFTFIDCPFAPLEAISASRAVVSCIRNSAVREGEWSASEPSYFVSEEKPIGICEQDAGWAPLLVWML
jgi:hypothetical protein